MAMRTDIRVISLAPRDITLAGLDLAIDTIRSPAGRDCRLMFILSPRTMSNIIKLTLQDTRVLLEKVKVEPATGDITSGEGLQAAVVVDKDADGWEVYAYRGIPLIESTLGDRQFDGAHLGPLWAVLYAIPA